MSFLPLYIMTKLQGKNFKVITKIDEIKSAFGGGDKGRMIEELFEQSAWYPLLSLESSNGDTWLSLKKKFSNFLKYLPSKQKLSIITTNEIQRMLETNEIIDSKKISIATAKIFLTWILCENE
jgi:hypothetical protein